MLNDGHMIPRDTFGLHFLTFAVQFRKTPGKTSTRKLTRSGIQSEPDGWKTTTFPPDHSGSRIHVFNFRLVFLTMHKTIFYTIMSVNVSNSTRKAQVWITYATRMCWKPNIWFETVSTMQWHMFLTIVFCMELR